MAPSVGGAVEQSYLCRETLPSPSEDILGLPQVLIQPQSGREDLNLRPHGPEPCALAKLSYAPSNRFVPSILPGNALLSIASRRGGVGGRISRPSSRGVRTEPR